MYLLAEADGSPAGRRSHVAAPFPPSPARVESVNVSPRRCLEPGGLSGMRSLGSNPSSSTRDGESAKNLLLPVTMPSVVSPQSSRTEKPVDVVASVYAASAAAESIEPLHFELGVTGFHFVATAKSERAAASCT